jgi:hypothetical protein
VKSGKSKGVRIMGRLIHFGCLVVVLLLALSMVSQAGASLVTDFVSFSASGFTSVPTGTTALTDPVTGSFTITFDPTLSYTNDTADITLNSLNISLGSALSFSYTSSTLTLGGLDGGAGAMLATTDDFVLNVTQFQTAPTFGSFIYKTQGTGTVVFVAQSGNLGVSAVPLPPALILFGSGLLGLVGLRKLRKS